MLLELGVIDSLIKLITHEDKTVKRFAVMSFGVMAGHRECLFTELVLIDCTFNRM